MIKKLFTYFIATLAFIGIPIICLTLKEAFYEWKKASKKGDLFNEK